MIRRGGAVRSQRCPWLPALVACLMGAVPVLGGAAGPRTVQLVVDCSIGTWRTLEDGTPGLVAARIAINELTAELGDRSKVRIGLRLMGSRRPFTTADACQDTLLLLPQGPAAALAAAPVLDGLVPRGRRPLMAAVVAAAADLADSGSGRRIVLVTAGEDDCGGDRAAAAAALRSGVELRVVGVALDPPALASFTAVAPTHNAASTGELAAALRWAVLDEDDGGAEADLTVHVVGHGSVPSGLTAALRSAVTRQDYAMAATGEGFQARVPAGQYELAVAAADGRGLAERYGITLAAGARSTATVEIGARPAPTLETGSGPWTAGDELVVRFAGAPDGRHLLEVAPAAAPAAAWTARAEAEGEAGSVTLPLPVEPLDLELRLVEQLVDGSLEPLATVPLQTRAPQAELEVAAGAPPGGPLSVGWHGPAQAGDEIVIARAGSPAYAQEAGAPAAATDPVTLTAPEAAGPYEVRYLSGVSGLVLARAELQVAPIPITLQVPEQVGVGQEFTVVATPAPPTAGLIILASPGAAPQEYLSWRPAAAAVSMTAPRRPGRYEVRCLGPSGDEVVARTTVQVVEIPVRLEVPQRVAAGSRFRVSWTGPAGPQDFIDVSRPNAPPRRHLDWAYATQGSPLDLAAPFAPGTYEVRYISGDDLEVLARSRLKVE